MKVSELIKKLQDLNTPDEDVAVYRNGQVIAVEPADEHNEVILVTSDSEVEL